MIIYQIMNKMNNKMYIGSTTRAFMVRKCEHINKLRSNKHYNPHLQSSWNEHGENNFKFVVLIELPENTVEFVLRLVEKMYIYNLSPEYNIDGDPTTNPMYGRNHTEETKRKIRETRIQLQIPSPMKGKVLTEEHKRKLSEAHRGKKQSWETIEKRKKTFQNIKLSLGETNPQAKLTEKKVLEIRELLKETNKTHAEIRNIYKVSSATVDLINTRKTWRHI